MAKMDWGKAQYKTQQNKAIREGDVLKGMSLPPHVKFSEEHINNIAQKALTKIQADNPGLTPEQQWTIAHAWATRVTDRQKLEESFK